MSRFIYFDTETSGFKPGQIGQLSAIIEENGKISGVNYFFEIDYINKDAEALLGRGLSFYKEKSNGLRFKDKAEEIKEIFNGSVFVAHNLKFDENFLSSELWRCKLSAIPESRLDTMEYYKNILKLTNSYGRIKNPSLAELVNGLNLDKEKIRQYCIKIFNSEDIDFHDARFDSTIVCIAAHMAKELNTENVEKPWTKLFALGA